jgi:hypothetical protein
MASNVILRTALHAALAVAFGALALAVRRRHFAGVWDTASVTLNRQRPVVLEFLLRRLHAAG